MKRLQTDRSTEKIKTVEDKLKRFLSYDEPPSQDAMELLDNAQEIQKKEEVVIKYEVWKEAKNSFGAKFKLQMENETDMHRRRIKKFSDSKKQYKIDLVKLTSIKKNSLKKDNNVTKIL